jgi:hypothetical protein
VENLRLLFEPLVRVLGNLPDNFSEVGSFAGQVLSGSPPNLLADTPYSQRPWPGYSQTAGLNYDLNQIAFPPQSVPVLTGIVPTGGIPALDQGLRAEAYSAGTTPTNINTQAAQNMTASGIQPQYYDGTYADHIFSPVDQAAGEVPPPVQQPPINQGNGEQPPVGGQATPTTDQGIDVQPATPIPTDSGGDLGIITPPTSP